MDMEEVDETTSPATRRVLKKNHRVPLKLRRVFQFRPYPHYSYEALATLLEPFQESLKRSKNVTYALSVRIFSPEGKLLKKHQIEFCNLPTYLITHIPLKYRGIQMPFGTRSAVSIGDLTGDGQCDFLHALDAKYKAAYNLAGEELWTYEDHDQPRVYNSVATRVYDVDADGRCEVITLRDGKLCLLDGATGKVKRAVPWPKLLGRRFGLEARIFLANLTGNEGADILVLNGYASNAFGGDVTMTALSGDLKTLWERADFQADGAVGMHSPNVADVDGDGRDEVSFGTTMLDDDGSIIWRLPYKPHFANGGGDPDHVDEGDIGDADDDGKLEILFASGTLVDAATGKVRLDRLPGIANGQWLRIRKIREDLPGKQLVIANKWAPPLLFSAEGKPLEWPFPFASWDLVDWDGDGVTELAGGGLVCDRRGRVVGVYDPLQNFPQFCDVTGNGRQEAMPWGLDMHGQRITVFSSAPRPEKRSHKLAVPRHLYNFRD